MTTTDNPDRCPNCGDPDAWHGIAGVEPEAWACDACGHEGPARQVTPDVSGAKNYAPGPSGPPEPATEPTDDYDHPLVDGFTAEAIDLRVRKSRNAGEEGVIWVHCADGPRDYKDLDETCKGGVVAIGLPGHGQGDRVQVVYSDSIYSAEDMLRQAIAELSVARAALLRLDRSNDGECDRLERLADETGRQQ